MLFARRHDKKKPARTRGWVAEQFSNKPEWRVVTASDKWLCPYCGQIGGRIASASGFNPDIQAHLVDQCTSWDGNFDAPTISIDILRQKAHAFDVHDKVLKDEAWRVADASGRWFCPFCARRTDILFPEGSKPTRELIYQIAEHLNNCYNYTESRRQPRSVRYLRRLADQTSAVERMSDAVKRSLLSNPIWRVKSLSGKWVCPYCKNTCTHIDGSTQIDLYTNAPPLIALHLVSECPAYQESKPPAHSVKELESQTALLPGHQSGIFRSPFAPEDANGGPIMLDVRDQLKETQPPAESDEPMMRSLEEARRIQRKMMPEVPSVAGFEFDCLYLPCAHVGGDFYDFVDVGNARIGILIGDVSGHGIDAALVMSMVRKVISMCGRGCLSARETLIRANAEIYPDLDRRTFISAFYLVLDTENYSLSAARAGHHPALLFNPHREPHPVSVLQPAGMVLGMDSGKRFASTIEETTVGLRQRDTILLFTDGLTETKSPTRAEFGFVRLVHFLKKHGQHEAKYMIYSLDSMLREFRGNVPQTDDVTAIAARVL